MAICAEMAKGVEIDVGVKVEVPISAVVPAIAEVAIPEVAIAEIPSDDEAIVEVPVGWTPKFAVDADIEIKRLNTVLHQDTFFDEM